VLDPKALVATNQAKFQNLIVAGKFAQSRATQ